MVTRPRLPAEDGPEDGQLPAATRATIGQREWERRKKHMDRSSRLSTAQRAAGVALAWAAALALMALMVIGVMAAWRHWL